MKYNIRGNKLEVTQAIKDYIQEKVSRLEKYFDGDVEVKVVISAKGKEQKVEVNLWRGKYDVRAEETKEDLYASIDLVVDKLDRQLKKYKDKITNKKRKETHVIEEYIEEETEEAIVRRKELILKPMDENEAILQMELLGHSFFVFKNEDTNRINVIYKRNDGDYGLIETK